MKRFWKEALAEDKQVLLDGKPVRTPKRNLLVLLSDSLAEAVAGSTLSRHDVAVHVKDAIERFTRLRTATAGATGSGTPSFIRWFLADRGTRTVSPRSTITVTEYNRRP